MEDKYTRITLRIPRELHSKLELEADKTSKSMNAEIVARLEQSFNGNAPKEAAGYVTDPVSLEKFILVNEEYRKLLDEKIDDLIKTFRGESA